MVVSKSTTPRNDAPGEGAELPREEASFGRWLRRQRELREIGLRDIAETTKISIRYLEALEDDRFEVLPAPVFARGFLREYSRFVGLDPDEVMNRYLSSAELDAGDDEEGDRSSPGQGRRLVWGLLLVLAVVLAVVSGVAFMAQRGRDQDETPPSMAPPPQVVVEEPEPVVVPEPVPTAPLEMSLEFTDECWIQVLVDGDERIERLMTPGESLILEAQQEVVIETLGDPSVVRIEVNGEPVVLDSQPGRVAKGLRFTAPEPEPEAESPEVSGGSGADQEGAEAGGEIP